MATTLRTRKSQNIYRKYIDTLDKSACEFCKFTPKSKQVLKNLKHFWIVDNVFGYDMWDSSGVVEHIMLVPKRHIESISQLNSNENQEFIDNLGLYEKKGYSIYARSHSNSRKSVAHQHTHFIKTDNKIKRFLLFVKKPHLLFMK